VQAEKRKKEANSRENKNIFLKYRFIILPYIFEHHSSLYSISIKNASKILTKIKKSDILYEKHKRLDK